VRSSEHKRLSNRELCRRFLDAYRPGRLDDLLALLHPEIEWTTTETWVEREAWYGHAGVRAGLRRFFSEWDDFSNDEVEAFSDGGDRFAVVTRMRGRSRGTHIPTEMRTSGVIEVRDGLIVRIVGHSDPLDALAAVAESAAVTPPPAVADLRRAPETQEDRAMATTDTTLQTLAFAVPILPGKTDTDRAVIESCRSGERQADHAASRARAGITRESVWIQSTPAGDVAVVVLEGNDIGAAIGTLATSQESFDTWFREVLMDVHGLDLSAGFSSPEQVLDYRA
jgi:ketosteroid isomerase-like protein/rhodanese-related sulfurtransferase